MTKSIRKNDLFKLEYGAFYNDIENLITLGLQPDNSFTYINVGTFSTIGNQLNVTYRTRKLRSNVRLYYIGRYNTVFDDGLAGNRFNWSPEISTNISYSLFKNLLDVNLFYKYNGTLKSFYINSDDELTLREQSDYSILDASLSANLLKRKLIVTLGGKNLLNVKDVVVTGQSAGVHSSSGNINAARGTSAFLSVKYNFQYDFKEKNK